MKINKQFSIEQKIIALLFNSDNNNASINELPQRDLIKSLRKYKYIVYHSKLLRKTISQVKE